MILKVELTPQELKYAIAAYVRENCKGLAPNGHYVDVRVMSNIEVHALAEVEVKQVLSSGRD